MTPPDPTTRERHVAVGHTRISAIGAFAPAHDDLFVTSYDDFEEVDLSEVASLLLVLDEGPVVAFDAVFDDACRWARRRDAS